MSEIITYVKNKLFHNQKVNRYKQKSEMIIAIHPQMQICYTINPYLWCGYLATFIMGYLMNMFILTFISGIFGGILFSIYIVTDLIGGK